MAWCHEIGLRSKSTFVDIACENSGNPNHGGIK